MNIHSDIFWPVAIAIGLLLAGAFVAQWLKRRAWEDGETR